MLPRFPPTTPLQVRIALRLLWAALTVAVLIRLGSLSSHGHQWIRSAVFMLAAIVAVQGYLILAMSYGQNRARWIDLLLVAFVFIAWPPRLASPHPFVNALDLGQVLAHLVAFALLFTGGANAWFNRDGTREEEGSP